MSVNPLTSTQKVELFLQYLEKMLDDLNMTVPEFAVLMEKPKMTVYKWVNRKNGMKLENYFKALDVLGTNETEFLKSIQSAQIAG